MEEESSPPYPKDVMTNSKDEMMNLEDTTSMATPQFVVGSNELNDPPMAPRLSQYVWNKGSDTFEIGNNYKA